MQDTSKMNVIKIDNKYYVKRIKSAICSKKVNDEYYLKCEIKMKGINYYKYKPGTNYLIKETYTKDDFKSKNILFLEEQALNTIKESLNNFDKYIELLNGNGFKHGDIILYYERKEDKIYSFITKYVNGDSVSYYYSEENKFRNIFHDYKSREEFINDSIYYKAARYFNDEILMLELLIRENLATNEDCNRLSELTGRIILPKADIKYNKTFVVDRDSIDAHILEQSGYRILHRPYFAMKGSTHDKWELNPYIKTGVDAAMKEEAGISFEEYKNLIINIKK